tara:strand:- start:149 stop:523 length:375 start_codon:yes stop_codon:yes gene_type:complete
MTKLFLLIASLSGFSAVFIGAFGAHMLKARLNEYSMSVYQTGFEYHFYHSLALLAVALLSFWYPQSTALRISGCGFVIGIVLFSGSLYLLSLTGISWLGAITPVGGVCFLVGWLALAIAAWRLN